MLDEHDIKLWKVYICVLKFISLTLFKRMKIISGIFWLGLATNDAPTIQTPPSIFPWQSILEIPTTWLLFYELFNRFVHFTYEINITSKWHIWNTWYIYNLSGKKPNGTYYFTWKLLRRMNLKPHIIQYFPT